MCIKNQPPHELSTIILIKMNYSIITGVFSEFLSGVSIIKK